VLPPLAVQSVRGPAQCFGEPHRQLPHSSLPASVFEPRPFLRLMAAIASRIAPDTHQDQAAARPGSAPWRHGRPRRTLVPPRIQKNFTEPWLPAGRRQSPDGLRCGRSAVTTAGDGDPASNSVQVVAAPVTVRGLPDRRRPSGKAARWVERLALLQDVITGARQLVCQRLGGNYVVGPGLLALVETLGFGTKAPGEVRRLDECPGEIFVAVLDVALAFLLAVAGVHAVDAARIGRIVADVGEPIDRTGFQNNDGGERLADARHAGQQAVLRSGLDAFLQGLFQNLVL